MISGINRALSGQPEAVLTGMLIAVALVCLLVAWRGSPATKLAIAAWVVAP